MNHSFPTRRSPDLELQALGLDYANRRGHAPAGRLNCCARSHAAKRCFGRAHSRMRAMLAMLTYLCTLRLPCSGRSRPAVTRNAWRSEEHTSELQSLMRISYAVFCLKKKKKN